MEIDALIVSTGGVARDGPANDPRGERGHEAADFSSLADGRLQQ